MKLKNSSVVAMVFAAFIIIAIGIFIVVGLCLPERAEIIQGEIETTDYRVSSKVPARVLEIRVQEGDMVRKGDTLAILEAPDVNAKLDQATALYEAAQALDEKARNGAQKEQVLGAYEMWQKAKAGLEVAEKSYRRVENLFAKGVISEQKRDEAKAQYDAMVATEKAAKSQYDLAKNGAQQEDKDAARAQQSRAQGAIAEVNSYLAETILRAQMDGEVTDIFPAMGELVGTGAPVMNVALTENMWLTFNVREDHLSRFKVGETIDVTIPALGDKIVKARVKSMKDLGSYAAWKATKTTGQYDMKTFSVKAVPVSKVEGLRAGMTVLLK